MLLLAGLLLPLVFPLAMLAQSALGPVDGSDLSPYDLKRVMPGDMAPDFRLQDENGKVHQLSQYRGKNVVLVMYRGFW
jgi:cytochrome oxidase Cu insertion factor (SCO1/SenC/PrrC family)